jgi:hypothetical protein
LLGNRIFTHIVYFTYQLKNETNCEVGDEEKDKGAEEELDVQVQVGWIVED